MLPGCFEVEMIAVVFVQKIDLVTAPKYVQHHIDHNANKPGIW